MGLKAYQFARINKHGSEENCYLEIAGQHSDWNRQIFGVIFSQWESYPERSSGSRTRDEQFEMILSGVDFQAQGMIPIGAEDLGTEFLFIFSDRMWDMALTAQFIPDYSDDNRDPETGARVPVLKSLTQLSAMEVE